MAPSVAQFEPAVADPIRFQVAKNVLNSQGTEYKGKVADKVCNFKLTLKIRDPPIPSTSLASRLTRNSPFW